jgi:hypothetical protein
MRLAHSARIWQLLGGAALAAAVITPAARGALARGTPAPVRPGVAMAQTMKTALSRYSQRRYFEASVGFYQVVTARGVPAATRGCTDMTTLDRWVCRALTVQTADELFD